MSNESNKFFFHYSSTHLRRMSDGWQEASAFDSKGGLLMSNEVYHLCFRFLCSSTHVRRMKV